MKFRRVALATVVLSLVTSLQAQGTLSVPANVQVGTNITIEYKNAARAGQTITVTIDDGAFPVPNQDDVQITLDANGRGSVTWTVPYWHGGKFRAPDAPPVSRVFS